MMDHRTDSGYRLDGLRVLVTGASRGFGRAIALSCVVAGADVAIVARDPSALSETASLAAQTSERRNRAIPIVADLSSLDGATRAAEASIAALGGVDVLVNCAASQKPIGPFVEADMTAWDHTVRLNLLAPANLMRRVLPQMIDQRLGRIVNISGGGAVSPRPLFAAYAAAKAALVRLTETIAEEVRPFNIMVNAVAPGALNTAMLDEIIEAGVRAGPEAAAAMTKRREGGNDLQRACNLVLFLAADMAGGLTGKLIAAQHDPWMTWTGKGAELSTTSMYTMRRIDHFVLRQVEGEQ